MASIGSTGWPYVQHRGGPKGFLKVLNNQTIAFPDYRGNKQYITTGNLRTDDRVALILVDYPRRARLKILGYAKITERADAKELLEVIRDEGAEQRTLWGPDWLQSMTNASRRASAVRTLKASAS
jgi:hypothetical protein